MSTSVNDPNGAATGDDDIMSTIADRKNNEKEKEKESETAAPAGKRKPTRARVRPPDAAAVKDSNVIQRSKRGAAEKAAVSMKPRERKTRTDGSAVADSQRVSRVRNEREAKTRPKTAIRAVSPAGSDSSVSIANRNPNPYTQSHGRASAVRTRTRARTTRAVASSSGGDGGTGILDRTRDQLGLDDDGGGDPSSGPDSGDEEVVDGGVSGDDASDRDYHTESGSDSEGSRKPTLSPVRLRSSTQHERRERRGRRERAVVDNQDCTSDSDNDSAVERKRDRLGERERERERDRVPVVEEDLSKTVFRKLRESGQTCVKHVESLQFSSTRTRKECLHLANFIDTLRADPKRGLELIVKRLVAVMKADQTGNWSIAEVLNADIGNHSLLTRDIEMRLMAEANRFDKLMKAADKSRTTGRSGSSRPYFTRRSGGRGGRGAAYDRSRVSGSSQFKSGSGSGGGNTGKSASDSRTGQQSGNTGSAAGAPSNQRFGGAGGRKKW